MALDRPFLLALATSVVGCLLLGSLAACSEPAPLTRDYRDEEEDDMARKDYFETAATTYYEGGRYDDSALMWRKVLAIEPNNQKAKWGHARALMGKRDPASLRQAEDILVSIINLDWNHPEMGDRSFELKRDLANVYGTLADYYERDIRVLDERLTNDPNADAGRLREQLNTQKRNRDILVRKAIPVYRDVLEQSPSNPYALAGLAKSHLMIGEEDVGLSYAQRYIEVARKSRQNWKQQMADYNRRTGGQLTQEQRKFFRDKIYGTIQKEKSVTLMMGSVFMRREEFGSAVAAYSRVLDIDDAEIAAYVERAQAYAGLGQYQMAVNDIEEYLKFTDPELHRQQRIKAGRLLQTYQRIVNAPGSMNPGGGVPARIPGAAPSRYVPGAPAPSAYGSAAPTPYTPPAPSPYGGASPSPAPYRAPAPAPAGFPAPAPRPAAAPEWDNMLPGAPAPAGAAPAPAAAPAVDPLLPRAVDSDLPGMPLPGAQPAPAPASSPTAQPAPIPGMPPAPIPSADDLPQLPPAPARRAPPVPPAAKEDGLGPPPAGRASGR